MVQNKNGNQGTLETILADTVCTGRRQIKPKSSLLLTKITFVITICMQT